MASLKDKRSQYSLTLAPIMPTLEGLRDAYSVVIRYEETPLFERCYRIWPDTPDGHWHVWRLFRACQLAEQLVESQTPFNISASGDPEFNEETLLNVNTGWLDVLLSADVIVHRHNRLEPWRESRCLFRFYLLESSQEAIMESPTFRSFSLVCLPAAVMRFGQELEAECREALRLRRELGLMAPADDYID